MRLSNKSTFSLASLILLLALGVVFGTTFVMAHAPDDTTVGPHTHPVTEAVAEDASATPPVLPVPLHNTHPVPVITLRSGQPNVRGNMIALDATTNTTFTLIVDYGTDVTDTATNTDTTGVADDDLSIADAAHATLQVDSTAATDATLAITRVGSSDSMFRVVVTPGLYPNADTAATATNDDTLMFRIQLPAGDLFSLQTTEVVGTAVDPVTVPGGESLASALYTFTLVDVLPPPEPDTTVPVLSIGTPTFDAGKGQVTFTITVTEANPGTDAGDGLSLSDITSGVTNGSVVDFADNNDGTYTVLVMPTDAAMPVSLSIAAGAVVDASDNSSGAVEAVTWTPTGYTPPVIPKVTFTSIGSATIGEAFAVTLGNADTTMMLADLNIGLSDITVTQTATDGTASVLARTYNGTTGVVTFTPTAAGTVKVAATVNGQTDESVAITVVMAARVAVAVTATPSATAVNGSTPIVVTLSATAPAMVPSDLEAADFTVMEGSIALNAVVNVGAVTGTVSLTITPAGTGNTIVTVAPSTTGIAKVRFAQVSVMVDRTAPTIEFSLLTRDAKADVAVQVGITVFGTDDALAVGDINVVQTVNGSFESLEHTYIAAPSVVTFTPNAMSTVVVSVDADAVMDAVGNGNAAANSGDIAVAAADLVDSTAPTATIIGRQRTERAFEVTITFNEALKAGETLTADEITVTNGSIANVAEHTTTSNAFTGTVTPDHGVRSVTIQVNAGAVKDASDNANAATPATAHAITVRSTSVPFDPPPSAASKLEGLVIPGKSFVLLTRANSEGLPAVLPSNASMVVWADMPDIEALFYSGGSINITVSGVGNRSVLFTEFMWARNLAKIGQTGELAHQWIEIYNNNDDPVTATVETKAGRPALAHGTDRVSNVVGAGWKLEDLGQNGSDDGEGGSAEVDFVSMYKVDKSAGDKDGSIKGHWGVSSEVYFALHKGTPGKFERSGVGTIGATSFNVGPIIFNEIANRNNSDKAYEWIELRNKSGGEVNLKNWQISIVTAVGQDNVFYDFPDADRKVPAGGLLLLVDTDPANDPNHPLQTGWNITKNAANQVNGVGAHSPRYMVADFKDDGLPDDGKFVLILRNRKDKRGIAEHLIDIAGYDDDLKVSAEDAGFTNLWPLKGGVRDAQLSNNKLEVNQVHRRQKDSIWGTSSTNYGRNGGNHGDDTAWRGVGWTSVGYKRNAARNSAHGGTPGFPNGAIKSDGGDAIAALVISEIMYDTSRNLPQWVEIQNLSNSIGVNLNNASLFIVNHHLKADGTDYTEGKLSERINIDNMEIPPNQTALVVSTGARSYTNLPNERVWNLRRGRGEKLLNPNGFQITLKLKTNEGDANKHQTADVVGNLPDAPAGSRPDEQSYLDALWDWPAGTDANGNRVSVARKTSTKIMTLDGRSAGHWLSSMDDPRLSLIREQTYYGHSNDVSSPGQTIGAALPVNLSSFRPTLEDGKVVIHWTTESELDNAGFNILRSETRNGEYKQVNSELIAGHGTTGERHTYKWVDQTAKPGVVYYYQIEDVSFAGEHQVLAVTKLKGLISAKDKLTTTWSELKQASQ